MLPWEPSELVAPLLVFACLAYAGQQGSETIDPHGKLQVFCPGNIKIRGSSGSKLTYRIKAPGRVTFTRQGRAAILNAPESPAIDITAPRGLELSTVNTTGGDLDVTDLDGSVAGQAAGRVTIGRVGGNVEIRSAGGPTSLGMIGGLVRCFSGGGAILAESIRGDALLETGGGDIVVQKAAGEVRAYTGGGGIHIFHADGMVTARNLGGPIQIGSAAAVQCQSASGAIRLNNVSGPTQASTMAGSILAQFLPGLTGMESFLSTAAGDITVLIPSNVHISIRAQNSGSVDLRSIFSDYPDLRVRSFRSAVLAEGPINGGGPLLRISGSGGLIHIIKK